jgi:hypothetical protein
MADTSTKCSDSSSSSVASCNGKPASTTHICFTMAACDCLQDLESKIVAACAGMPLVLELAGGRLRYKRDTDLWQVSVIVMILQYEYIVVDVACA